MILLRPRASFRTQRRKRWPLAKITRTERVANIQARQALIETLEPVFLEIFDAFRLDVDDQFRRQLLAGGAIGVPQTALVSVEADLTVALGDAFRDAIDRGAQIGLRFSGLPGIALEPALVTQLADNWIASKGAAQISRINSTTRRAVRESVSQALTDRISPETAARRIGREVGLSPRDAKALRNFESQLVRRRIRVPEADTQFVREAIANDVENYREALIRRRGRMIAETEMQNAIQQGERMFWEQAIANEQVDGGLLLKRWFTVQDERVCPICAPLHGQVRPFVDSYSSRGWTGESPPAHQLCRCYMQYAPAGEFT